MIQIPHSKYWNTWSTKSPTAMSFLPAGFSIKISAYSFAEQKYTSFPFSKDIKLYEHHPNGDYCRLEAEHAGTVMDVEYLKTDSWTVMGRLKLKKAGEWGLRFWILLSFGFEGSGEVKITDTTTVHGKMRSYDFAVLAGNKPVRSAVVEDVDSAGRDMEESGYYVPEKSCPDGKWALFKYNLEETPEIYFSVNVANSFEEATQRAKSALELYSEFDKLKEKVMSCLPKQSGELPDSIDAIRDVMAWNTIEDKINNRVFTSITRYWIDKKFGGWFMWQDDIFYHALLNAFSGDFSMARENLNAVMSTLTPDGNLACLMSEYTEWVDRSQPPIGAFILWKYSELTGDRQILKTAYPLLKSAHEWWFKNRDGNNNGVLEYGSSCNGHGHFTGTKLAAKDESSMDNSPMYDTALFVESAHTMNIEDIALNSLLALDGEILSEIAKQIGLFEDSKKISEVNNLYKSKIDKTLWDEKRDIYANKHWESGFVACSPTSFYPMAAGIPDSGRAEKLVEHIFNENEFWTFAPLPSISANELSVRDNVYWRGRLWAPLNFFTYIGLKRYRKDLEAYRLAKRGMEIFTPVWRNERACYENLNSFTGQGKDSVDSDPFYGWGALIPLIWIMEHIDIDPWNGFNFGDVCGGNFSICGIRIKDGLYNLNCHAGETNLERNGMVLLKSNAEGRFRNFIFSDHYASVELDGQQKQCTVTFPSCTPLVTKVNGEVTAPKNSIQINKNTANLIELWF